MRRVVRTVLAAAKEREEEEEMTKGENKQDHDAVLSLCTANPSCCDLRSGAYKSSSSSSSP